MIGRPTKNPRAVIHVDLDGLSHICRIHGWSNGEDGDLLYETGLERALALFDAAEIRATLFVIGEDLENDCKLKLVKEAVRRGHEIASHSLTHRKLTTLSTTEKRREIFESRSRISDTLGVKVLGFRAPAFDIDQESLELIAAAGYAYDSSLFPRDDMARKVGLGKIYQSPHYPFDNAALLELPLPSYAPLPFPFHPCYSLVLGKWYFTAGLRMFEQTGAPLVVLFHLTDFADPIPSRQLPNLRAKFFTLSLMSARRKESLCESMLRAVEEKYQITSSEDLLVTHCGKD